VFPCPEGCKGIEYGLGSIQLRTRRIGPSQAVGPEEFLLTYADAPGQAASEAPKRAHLSADDTEQLRERGHARQLARVVVEFAGGARRDGFVWPRAASIERGGSIA